MTTVKCPECGSNMTVTDTVCPQCGRSLSAEELNLLYRRREMKFNLFMVIAFIMVSALLVMLMRNMEML